MNDVSRRDLDGCRATCRVELERVARGGGDVSLLSARVSLALLGGREVGVEERSVFVGDTLPWSPLASRCGFFGRNLPRIVPRTFPLQWCRSDQRRMARPGELRSTSELSAVTTLNRHPQGCGTARAVRLSYCATACCGAWWLLTPTAAPGDGVRRGRQREGSLEIRYEQATKLAGQKRKGTRQPRAGDVSLPSATDRTRATCRPPRGLFCPVGGRTCAYASVETPGWLRRGSD